ncbi:hypothetical protein [Bradyrhizobium paxllaeri]|uniref:hypothetical protein n=1 Tax=Bradyrhizobium paxllaeri TaxID=190148 RepID=UPI0008109017|nr:hypothetical protein [Bradyrhizobium paxllaeri]
MKRIPLFLLLGPALVAIEVLMFVASMGGGDRGFAGFCAMLSFLLTMPVSAITGIVDRYLAGGLPTLLRAPMTAIIGMMIVIGIALVLYAVAFWQTVPPEVMNAARWAGTFLLLPMGLCSLLSSDYGNRPVKPAGDCGALS